MRCLNSGLSFWISWTLLVAVVLIASGCSGGVYTASRSELDGDPVVREGSREPAPAAAIENFWTPESPVVTAPPAPKNEVILGEDKKEEVAIIKTQLGEIRIRFFDKVAPKSVENFKSLIRDDFYNKTTFHRIVPGFVIQGGDPITRDPKNLKAQHGTGGPGYTVAQEIGLPHVKGAVAMARLGNDVNPEKRSNGSQFYICLEPQTFLDGDYTVFGQVEAGMEVVEAIANLPRDDRDNPQDRVEMLIRLEKRMSP